MSLFDFQDFDSEKYSEHYPLSSWYEFVPFREKWGSAIWIEIDRIQAASHLISGADLLSRWNAEKAFAHMIMPHIEAAYIGALPCSIFSAAIAVREGEDSWRPLKLSV